jgi:hypothetical protein
VYGFKSSPWRIRDAFGDTWTISFPSVHERRAPAGGGLLWEQRLVVDRLVASGFDPAGARDDEFARALIAVYDALTGARLAEALPRPMHDPRALLRGFDREIREALGAAVAFDRVRIEQAVPPRWPFVEEAPVSEEAAPASVGEVPTWIGLSLVDQTGRPVPSRAYRVIFPDGTIQDGKLDTKGGARLGGTVPGTCQVYCPYAVPHPRLSYTVQQGDHLSGIAQSFGFDDYTVVWNDPGNADLKSRRADPHVLVPGDSLVIPELKVQPLGKPTGVTHTFTILQSPLKLRFKMLDFAGNPIVAESLTIAGTELATDGTGLIEANVEKLDQVVQVQCGGSTFVLTVGAINPPDDTSDAGYKARLYNLGFLWDPSVDDSDDEMVIALQDFQAQYQLPITGQLDDATKTQLAQTHGS